MADGGRRSLDLRCPVMRLPVETDADSPGGSCCGLVADGRGGRVSAGEHAAVDGERGSGDPAGAVAGEKENRLDDVGGVAVSAEGMECVDALEDVSGLVWGHEALVGGRLDERERDGVDA